VVPFGHIIKEKGITTTIIFPVSSSLSHGMGEERVSTSEGTETIKVPNS